MSQKGKHEKRNRSCTDSEVLLNSSVTQHMEMDNDISIAPQKTRLFELFDQIEKEFDLLYNENTALRSRLSALTGGDTEVAGISVEPFSSSHEVKGGSSRKAMQMGQKLRTALRGPPSRLVFKVGNDGSKFRLSRVLEGHRDGVWHVASDVNNNICASASADQTACVWSLETGALIATYVGHTGSVNCISFAPRNDSNTNNEVMLATASGDESAHVWKSSINCVPTASSEEESDEKEKNHNEIGETDTKSDGNRVKTPLIRLTGHTGPVVGCEWMAEGNQLLTASWDRSANIYDVERGEVVNILSGHELELNHCSAHPNQKLVATASKDSTFRLWDFRETIQSVAVFQGHQDSVTSVAFSSGDRIVSGSDDRTVKVWDLRNMRCAITTIRLSSPVNRLALSQNHGLIAIPLDNRHVRIYDLAGNRLARVPNRRCHSRMVTSVAWCDDHPQSNLLSSGFDRLVACWKVAMEKGT